MYEHMYKSYGWIDIIFLYIYFCEDLNQGLENHVTMSFYAFKLKVWEIRDNF